MADLLRLALHDSNHTLQLLICSKTSKNHASGKSLRYQREGEFSFVFIRSTEGFRMTLQSLKPNGLELNGVFPGKSSNKHIPHPSLGQKRP